MVSRNDFNTLFLSKVLLPLHDVVGPYSVFTLLTLFCSTTHRERTNELVKTYR